MKAAVIGGFFVVAGGSFWGPRTAAGTTRGYQPGVDTACYDPSPDERRATESREYDQRDHGDLGLSLPSAWNIKRR